jgi:hypothetical protein
VADLIRQKIITLVRTAAVRLAIILAAIALLAVVVKFSGLIGDCYEGFGMRGGWREVTCKH